MSANIYSLDHSTITKLLKKARLECRYTQAEVAAMLGVTQSYISKIESGQIRIDVISLQEFARVYKKKVNWFLK